MVRYKKRYLVVQFEPAWQVRRDHDSSKSGKSKGSLPAKSGFVEDAALAKTIKEAVRRLHGDHGLASVSSGLRVVYANPETRLTLVQCRHGPHMLVASSLPFVTSLKPSSSSGEQSEAVVPRLIYTGATIRHCYKEMIRFQRHQLEAFLKGVKGPENTEELKAWEDRLMKLRAMKGFS